MAANIDKKKVRITTQAVDEQMPVENWKIAERLIVELMVDMFLADHSHSSRVQKTAQSHQVQKAES